MLRSDIVQNLNLVAKLIKETGFLDVLSLVLTGRAIEETQVIGAFKNIISSSGQIKNNHTIAKSLINTILSPEWVESALALNNKNRDPKSPSAAQLIEKRRILHSIFMEASAYISATEQIIGTLSEHRDAKEFFEDQECIDIIFPESNGKLTTANQIYSAISAITKINDTLLEMQGESQSQIFVVSCDSGSEKLLSIAGK